MRTLLILAVGLLAVGCGKTGKPLSPEEESRMLKPELESKQLKAENIATAKPVKEPIAEEKALKDSVVGEYILGVQKYVFLKDGILEWHENGKVVGKAKWEKSNGQIHIKLPDGRILATRTNKDKSITCFAIIDEGRTDLPKEAQWTYKRIK